MHRVQEGARKWAIESAASLLGLLDAAGWAAMQEDVHPQLVGPADAEVRGAGQAGACSSGQLPPRLNPLAECV